MELDVICVESSNGSIKNTNLVNIPLDMFNKIISTYDPPYNVKLTCNKKQFICSVNDSCEDGFIEIPKSIMINIPESENNVIRIEYLKINVPKIKLIQIKSLSSQFHVIRELNKELENTISKYSYCSKDQIFPVECNGNIYKFCVSELIDANNNKVPFANITNCDVEVDILNPFAETNVVKKNIEEKKEKKINYSFII